MAKAVKSKKKKPNFDISVKTNLSADELLKVALNTSLKKNTKSK